MFTGPLHSKGSYSMVACLFVAAGIWLPSPCLAMNVCSDFPIPAFGRHITVFLFAHYSVPVTPPNVIQYNSYMILVRCWSPSAWHPLGTNEYSHKDLNGFVWWELAFHYSVCDNLPCLQHKEFGTPVFYCDFFMHQCVCLTVPHYPLTPTQRYYTSKNNLPYWLRDLM
jgi:hypothetical protein